MERIYLGPTALAQWHALVQDAEQMSGKKLVEDLENYLVLLLEKFARKPEVANTVLALDYLNAQQQQGAIQQDQLRDVGDCCLLFSGLFPERATRHHVTVSYYVRMGKQAYHVLAQSIDDRKILAELFNELDAHFVVLMDTLQYMRELTEENKLISPLQAEDLWRTTGSQHALQVLHRHTRSLPNFRVYFGDLN